jgi:hypothetical protein
MRTLILLAALATGCMSNSAYKVRDANGWPVPTWAARKAMRLPSARVDSVAGVAAGPRYDRVAVSAPAPMPSIVIHAPATPPPPPAPPPTIGVVVQ